MENYQETVGIDVSKNTLEVHLYRSGKRAEFESHRKGLKQVLKWVLKTSQIPQNQLLFCFEHTGLYSLPLAAYLAENKVPFAMVPALAIKRSLGMVRGKNDKVDAQRIAEYAYMRRDKLEQTTMPSQKLLKLQQLLTLRERMVKQRAGYIGSVKEYKSVFKKKDHPELFKSQDQMIRQLTKNITLFDEKIREIIREDKQMDKLYKLITSVKGIGLIIAAHMLVTTHCFETFDDSRKYACYCGIAPFEKQSGTSLKARSRVSHYANKRMKTLINLASFTAIQYDNELKAYYNRRLKEGKSKMSTMNIIRNKLIHRVFAVVKRQTPYVDIYRHAA